MMGAGIPTGIAAKMLNPDKKVLCVVGDGGFMMSAQEIETALRYHVPVVILVLNDNAFGFIKWKQRNMGLDTFGVDVSNPDFARYADSFGAKGYRIKEGDCISDVLNAAFNEDRPIVIECPIDYSANYETFSRELGNLVCQI
jgi:acetolactate synthase-1/2/3 large subunit